jgi:hypothetical protein
MATQASLNTTSAFAKAGVCDATDVNEHRG